MSNATFRNEIRDVATCIRKEYDAVTRELLSLNVPYNDVTNSYVATAKRLPAQARVLAKKHKKLDQLLNMLSDLDDLYSQD